ncbi:MAG: DNA polymerase III subunit gamma/tau [Candidatus Latescibacteria bacterium]|nr:DNA polymerase III subunit gamma/tau [Candidatus Latescibacterota bacterium]
MSYHALARKYRPATFDAMVGQEHVTRTLRAALRRDKLAHAYLFSGPRGCGKTTVARLLAKALNCTGGVKDEPCGACEACAAVAAGSSLDVLEIDAASHTGVDNVRELRDMAQYTPSPGASRVFIIDEVHMLSKGAFNALLKILEEPPARVFFFFATTEPAKIPRTILSRCQRFDFRLLTREELSARLTAIAADEGVQLEPGALRLIVAQAEGSMRDALSILDQVLAASPERIDEQAVVDLFGLVRSEVAIELNEAVMARDPGRALRLADSVAAGGQSLDDFAHSLVDNFRNLLLLRIDPALAAGISLPEDQIAILRRQAEHFAPQDLLALLDRASRGFERIHRSGQPRVLLEALLVELVLLESRVVLSDLVRRLEALTGSQLTGGGGPQPARAAGAGRSPAPGAKPPSVQTARAEQRDRVAQRGAPQEPDAPRDHGASQVRDSATAAAATTVDGWPAFVETLLGRQPALGSCIMEGIPAEEDGRISLCFPVEKQFQLQLIQKDLPRLQELARELLGRDIVLNLVSGADPARREHREELRRSVAPTEHEALQRACGGDAALDNLVRRLDAEVVPEADRDGWHTAPDRGGAAQRED